MAETKEKWKEVLEGKKKEEYVIKLGLAFLLGALFFFIQPYISKIFYPKDIVEIYSKLDELKREANLSSDIEERKLILEKIKEIEGKIGRGYPLRPNILDVVRSINTENWVVFLNFVAQVGIVIIGFLGFWLFYRKVPLRFVFRQPEIEPPINYGKFDEKLFQPEKWGITKEQFLSLFKSKEDYEKFVRIINKRLIRRVELFDGGSKVFNPDEVNELIGKLLNIIEREGDILQIEDKKVDISNRWHMRASLGLAIFHRILFWFGHIPEGVLSIFIKDDERGKITKLVLAEYLKGRTLRPVNPVFEKAGKYLSYLHLAKVSAYDFPEDFELFTTPELSIIEYIDKKFKTLPD